MVSISLCMIVKNEEDMLVRCLDSVSELVDEIIIVDTGSTDCTREIAARFTDEILYFPWRDDFAAARNKSFSHATMDYCLWLDAGKVLEPREQFYYGRELYYHRRWEEAPEVFERFLEEGRSWVENNIDACCHCAYCQKELGHEQEALETLLRTFAYDRPRAEVCCDIGLWFFQKEKYQQAAYWCTLALTCVRDDRRGGFVSPDCYGYLPCIQLCVCCSHLGNQKSAEIYNELAVLCKPDSPAVRYNRAVFQALSEQTA